MDLNPENRKPSNSPRPSLGALGALWQPDAVDRVGCARSADNQSFPITHRRVLIPDVTSHSADNQVLFEKLSQSSAHSDLATKQSKTDVSAQLLPVCQDSP
jgi:hypothetical protein